MATDSLEKIAVKIFPDETDDLSRNVAETIAKEITNNNKLGKKTVLGLATGNSPLDVYRHLIRMHQEEDLDFSNVVTFNLDEYYGLEKENVNSYYRFMQENLFSYINIKLKNIHIPDGTIPMNKLEKHCVEYEKKITDAGGIDIQILGIGKTGHIGFNEPGSSIEDTTRLITLDEITKKDALPDFGEKRYIPTKAITIGPKTIINAKKNILIATGDKAPIIRKAVEGDVSSKVVASFLQNHENTVFYLDEAAASQLTRKKTPWVVTNETKDYTMTQAVCYVSEKTNKPVIELTNEDFKNNNLGILLKNNSLSKVKRLVREDLENKIYEKNMLPTGMRILVFSPHPDDDVISMGGTLIKLVENGNDVYVAYMTSGATAVFDYSVENLIRRQKLIYEKWGKDNPHEEKFDKILNFIKQKRETRYGLPDTTEVIELKTILRQDEAIDASRVTRIAGYEFLNLPFYKTGIARKDPITQADIDIVSETINKYNPNIVYAASDLTDPNGTHRLCLKAIKGAIKNFNKINLWTYKGAWQEFQPWEADVFVPLTKDDMAKKIEAIHRHQTQEYETPQPGQQKGEFWERAMKRNENTAQKMFNMGISNYYAMEAFKILKP